MSDSRNRGIALLSGGLDSVVSLTCACHEMQICLALTVDYGQRAACREIEAARRCCRLLDIPQRVIRLQWLADITTTALVNRSMEVPQPAEHELNGGGPPSTEAAKAVWVPNRNGLFIHIAAAFAEHLKARSIVTGFNREEGRTFPDNSADFVAAVNRSLALSTLESVQVKSYTQHLAKADIVRLGIEKKAPLSFIYSCYMGGKRMCGLCESCVRVKRAFVSTGNWDIIRHTFQNSR